MPADRLAIFRTSAALLVGMPGRFWSYRDLIVQMTLREVGQRYRGTFLGMLWSFLMPLLMLIVYTVVFSAILPSKWPGASAGDDLGEFALMLFAGLIPFTVFSEVIARAPLLILNVPNYVKRVVFPLEILPVVAIGSAVCNSLMAIVILLAGSVVFRGGISPLIVLLPVMYVPLVLLCLGLAWFLAALGVYVRDVGHLVSFILQMLIFLTPVFYPVTSVPRLKLIMHLNPLTAIIEGFRHVLLGSGEVPVTMWLMCIAGSAALALLGYVFFMKTKSGFADVL